MFNADLHIHSRFSRATARNLNLPTLDWWAGRKGIKVLGTGDLTHPQWLAEIEEHLLAAEEGLFRLRPEYAQPGGGQARFMLSGEISCIYKKNGRVRKIHSVILMPDLASARRLNTKLETIGNIKSDGRPILGLDVRNLLALCLEASPEAFLIPAHIWTPWFSLLGSQSGFDTLEECFEDLTDQITALETGLSSDPPMNWRLSALDRFVLVSNSDAHSPDKIGREANLFNSDLSYPDMIRAMKGRGGFGGTIEFYPEEGKYHLDGHRKCQVCLEPEETQGHAGICPVCGRPVTVGVMNRVIELADRPKGIRPSSAPPYHSLVPLTEVLAEVLDQGPNTKRVAEIYEHLLNVLGPELGILREISLSDIRQAGGDLIAEAVDRMRRGQIQARPGYDGEFGWVGLFTPGERAALVGQVSLFPNGPESRKKKTATIRSKPALTSDKTPRAEAELIPAQAPSILSASDPLLDDLNPEQRAAVICGPGPLYIVAGPGTGKTKVLTRRIAWLVREGQAKPREILGITFTRQAAREMSARLAGDLPFRPDLKQVPVMTFHALGLCILTEHLGAKLRILSEEERLLVAKQAAIGGSFKAPALLEAISLAKQRLTGPGDQSDAELARVFGRYEVAMAAIPALDFDDLVTRTVAVLETKPDLLDSWRRRYPFILIDEYQDLNLAQYRLTRLLAAAPKPNLTVIGDPDQAIYGFRGADAAYFQRFKNDYSHVRQVRLTRNYRSTETIIKAACQVIAHNRNSDRPDLTSEAKGPPKLTTAVLASPAAEAEYLIRQIEKLLGGTSH
ncbi:MAG: UvrD-helicase domain-containing protein, partial [Deltaproteobacteria bacterium]|nr:UvrD-helicase domain-containing protein [Deltaproteobacteria bacterium]